MKPKQQIKMQESLFIIIQTLVQAGLAGSYEVFSLHIHAAIADLEILADEMEK